MAKYDHRMNACLTLESLEARAVPATCTVSNLADAGVGSGLQGDLRYCLNLANENSESSNRIEFAPGVAGTIKLALGELTILKDVDIDGPDSAALVIDANFQSGIIDIPQAAGAINVRMDDLTLTKGIGIATPWREGGGLHNYFGNVTLTRVVVSGNVIDDQLSSSGGGIANIFGTMTLTSCIVSKNAVWEGVGGGIDNVGGTMTLIDSVVSDNKAKNFAGISNRGTLTIVRGSLTGNVAQESGGAIDSLGTLTVIDSDISRNAAPWGGAAIYNVSGSVTVRDTTMSENRGTAVHTSGWTDISGSTIAGNEGEQGGGFYVYGGTLRVTNSTISGNVSRNMGGGINIVSFELVPESIVELTACTITGNVAEGGFLGKGGGGIEVIIKSQVAARVVMDSCIVSGNSTNGSGPDVHGPVISLGYNFIGNGKDSSGWVIKDNVGTPAAPLDPLLGPLGDYGGKTWTHALPANSPAKKRGDPGLSGSSDQRGTWRQPYFNPDPGSFQTSDVSQLKIIAPKRVMKGEAFVLTVVALDGDGNHATLADITLHFTSTDASAELPADYTLSAGDLGSHEFTATLNTPGAQKLTAIDPDGFPFATVEIQVRDGRGALPQVLPDTEPFGTQTPKRRLRRL